MAYNTTRRYRYITDLETMQKIFDIAEGHTDIMLVDSEDEYLGKNLLKDFSFVINGDRYYKVTTSFVLEKKNKDGSFTYEDINLSNSKRYACTFIFDKTGLNKSTIHASRIGKIANRVYKPFNEVKENPEQFTFDEGTERIQQSASAELGFNPKYDKTEHNVVCYDLNSAYAAILQDKIIDTYNKSLYKTVEENEVGFMLYDRNLTLVKPGSYADIVYPLIDSPYKEFSKKYYEIKKTAPKGSPERDLAKQILVVTVGLMQHTNPYLRAYIVNSCNEFILKLKDKYYDKVCLWNTDAIYTTEHIAELDDLVGDEIGQFKIEYEGLFRQSGLNYQKVELNKTSYRGIISQKFGKDYNILTDPLPCVDLKYRMNENTLRIEETI